MNNLSKRLMSVAQMVSPGLPCADIGCDHAYLSIYLVKNNISPKVIACDVNDGPIMKASENIKKENLSELIECRKADGLSGISTGEVESVVISGMGGRLMMDIMHRGMNVLAAVKEVILEPQSEVEALRYFIRDNDFKIISESMVYEDGKYYPVMKLVHGKMDWIDRAYYRYGKILVREQNPILHMFLIRESEYLESLLGKLEKDVKSDSTYERIKDIKEDLKLNVIARELMAENDFMGVDRVIN